MPVLPKGPSRTVSRWTIRIFFIFFLLGEGEGRVRAGRGGSGSVFFTENPNKGGGFPGVGAGSRGREDVWGIFGGGGAKYFFSGPRRPPRFLVRRPIP